MAVVVAAAAAVDSSVEVASVVVVVLAFSSVAVVAAAAAVVAFELVDHAAEVWLAEVVVDCFQLVVVVDPSFAEAGLSPSEVSQTEHSVVVVVTLAVEL